MYNKMKNFVRAQSIDNVVFGTAHQPSGSLDTRIKIASAGTFVHMTGVFSASSDSRGFDVDTNGLTYTHDETTACLISANVQARTPTSDNFTFRLFKNDTYIGSGESTVGMAGSVYPTGSANVSINTVTKLSQNDTIRLYVTSQENTPILDVITATISAIGK